MDKIIIICILSSLLYGCSVNNTNEIIFDNKEENRQESVIKNDAVLNKLATPENPVISPSGKYLLEVVQGYNGVVHYNRFVISKYKGKNIEPEVVFCSKDTFRTRDKVYFMWYDKEDSVYVYSSDTGSYRWDMEDDSSWIKHNGYEENIVQPELMKLL